MGKKLFCGGSFTKGNVKMRSAGNLMNYYLEEKEAPLTNRSNKPSHK